MTLVEVIEIAKYSTEKRAIYHRVLLGFLLTILLFSAAEFSGWTAGVHARKFIDFDDFHLVARLLWLGQIRSAYHLPALSAFQKSLSGLDGFLPWSYPPQFVLLLAPLAFLPIGVAYLLFTGVSCAAYLAVLKRVAGNSFVPVLIITFPALLITIRCGQNGFLTGTLIGLACLGFGNHRSIAGLPLGLMIIKPHLAVAFALYAVINRRWGAVFIATATVLLSTVLATAVLGFGIWPAFFGGIREAGIFLSQGFYPLFRMVSLYAAVRSLGLPEALAMAIQVLATCVALAAVVWASRRLAPHQALGVAAMASVLVSPYVYDYDLPIFAVGLVLLHDDIVQFAGARERLAIYGLIAFSSGFGLVDSFRLGGGEMSPDMPPWALAGFALFAAVALVWRVTVRSIAQPSGGVLEGRESVAAQ
ncbi:MAG: DUF2029 domain-containing protein [Alphaproteobacteria bacterium]|nr:DUF2029 domain-containing protein [Alphaproteobacteria bacterium]